MSFQSFPFAFTQNQAFINPQTGQLTTTGRNFDLALFNRTGAGTGIVPVISSPLTAAGNSQQSALLLAADWNLVGTVDSGTGVVFPSMKPGNDIWVWNAGGNALSVYPFSGANFNGQGANAPYSLAVGSLLYAQCWTTTLLLKAIVNASP